MPTHKIHLAIAKKVNDKLKLDLDSIMLGSVLPDLNINANHTISHYQNGKLGIEGTANPDVFIENNKDKLSNPIMIGYLVHLLTDKFYNTFAFSNFYIYDENGMDVGLHFKNKDKYLPFEKIKHYKHREFALYDYWLLNNDYVSKFKDFKCIDNVIDFDVAKFDKEKLRKYIVSSNLDIDNVSFLGKYKPLIFKLTTKKEMDKQFELCIKYILDYIKEKVY